MRDARRPACRKWTGWAGTPRHTSFGLRMGVFFIMLAQKIFAEVALEIAPRGMNVVVVVLGIIVFEQERRALNAIIVSLTALDATRPCELHFVEASLLDFREIVLRQLGTIPLHISPDHFQEGVLLVRRWFRRFHAGLFQRFDPDFGLSNDFFRGGFGKDRSLAQVGRERFDKR